MVAALAACSYAFGFVIVNSFFISYGAVPFSLLNVKHLSAGASFVVFYLASGVIFAGLSDRPGPLSEWREMVAAREERFADQASSRWRGLSHLGFAVGYFLNYLWRTIQSQFRYLLVFIFVVGLLLLVTRSDASVLYDPWLYLWSFAVNFSFSLIVEFAAERGRRQWAVLPWALVGLLISAVLYGREIYSYVSPTIGGGIPIEVRLSAAQGHRKHFVELGLVEGRSATSRPLQLMFESEHAYFVIVERDSAERIAKVSKDSVAIVQYGE